MSYIINSTRAFNRQLCTLGNSNGIALNIRQFLVIQVKRNDLICRNRNILGVIIIQSNGSTIFRLVNLLLQSLGRCSFTGTSAVSRLNAIRRKCHRRHGQHHHHSEKSR